MTETSAPVVETTEAPPLAFAEPPRAHRRRGRRWIALALIGLFMATVVAYGVVGAVEATQSIDRAQAAVQVMFDHQKALLATLNADPFSELDMKADPPDVAGAKAALAEFEPNLAPALTRDRADEAALQKARGQLATSFLTLPERGMMGDARSRIDAALAGLASADQQLVWRQQEIAFLHPYLDAVAGWVALEKASAANDLVGMAAQLPAIADSQRRASALAKPPAVPPQIITLVGTLQTMLNDVHGLLNAVQTHNRSAVSKYEAALNADGTALSNLDTKAVTDYEHGLFNPLVAEYNKEMKLAAAES